MGASTSHDDGAAAVPTLEELMAEANAVLVMVTGIITQTIATEVTNMMTELQGAATNKLNETFQHLQDKLAEIAHRNEIAEACAREKEPELQAIRDKMQNGLRECCAKHRATMEKLIAERENLHAEAEKFQLEVKKVVQTCMTNSENRFDCFRLGIIDLRAKAAALVKKVETMVKRESAVTSKSTKQLLECNIKFVNEANKQWDRVMKEIEKCTQKA